MAVYNQISQIPQFNYGLIMADPPWSYKNWSKAGYKKNAVAQYDCMSLDDIKAMPVGNLASKDCLLWLWITNPLLPQAFEIIDAWGFKYVTAGHWVKKTKRGKLAFGTGYVLRCAGEPFIIAKVGNPKTAKNVRSVIEGPIREHSRKPDESFVEAERLCGNVSRLELFSRQPRDGWDVFGNDVNRFGGSA